METAGKTISAKRLNPAGAPRFARESLATSKAGKAKPHYLPDAVAFFQQPSFAVVVLPLPPAGVCAAAPIVDVKRNAIRFNRGPGMLATIGENQHAGSVRVLLRRPEDVPLGAAEIVASHWRVVLSPGPSGRKLGPVICMGPCAAERPSDMIGRIDVRLRPPFPL